MKTQITTTEQPAMMSSREIAKLTDKRPADVIRDIWVMLESLYSISKDDADLRHHKNQQVTINNGVISSFDSRGYVSEILLDRRHTEILITGYDVVRRAAVIDRWFKLETERARPKSQAELIAEMALLNVEQERRLNHVEEKIETVTETIESIKRGTMRAGYVGYRQVVAKSGMTDAKCRNLVNAYSVPTDTHEFMTPDGLLSRRAIVELDSFMRAFHRMMSEAEPRGTRWYHPKMGLFQAIGWEPKQC